MIIVCAGNARSGSTLQYDIVCQLMEGNGLDYEALGFQSLRLINRKNLRPDCIYILKDHLPDTNYLQSGDKLVSIVRCKSYVMESLENFDGFSNANYSDIILGDYKKILHLASLRHYQNVLIQTYDSITKTEELANFINIPHTLKTTDNSHKGHDYKFLLKLVPYIPKPLKLLLPLKLKVFLRHKLNGVTKRNLFHPKHKTGTDSKKLDCDSENCSLCLLRNLK